MLILSWQDQKIRWTNRKSTYSLKEMRYDRWC